MHQSTKSGFLAILFLFSGLNLNAQIPEGSQEWLTLTSPFFYGSGTSVAPENTVAGSLMNPAAAGDRQRVTLDLNYTALVGTQGDGLGGSVGLVGISIPNHWGVFTGSIRGMVSNLSDFKGPGAFGINFSYARDVYKDLMLGIGLDVGAGSYPGGSFDFSLNGSLGLIHRPGKLGDFEDFFWGLTLRDLGKTLTSPAGSWAPGIPFTAALGTGFSIIKTSYLLWNWHLDLSTPGFQDFRFSLGTSLKLGNLQIRSAVQGDLANLNSSLPRSLLPSLSIGYNFVNDFGKQNLIPWWSDPLVQKNEILPQVGVSFVRNNVLALGGGLYIPLGVLDKNAPAIQLEVSGSEWLSPNNDGKKDKVTLSTKIIDERYVSAWSLTVKDEKGQVVRTIRNKDERPENQGLIQGFFTRLTTPKTGIMVPNTMEWNGLTDQGTVAPDGKYSLLLEAKDDNENQGESKKIEVFLRNTPPALTLNNKTGDDLILSPDGDGLKDTITFIQKGSKEKKWTWEIQNSFGQQIKTGSVEDQELADITWDGKDNQGNLVPDGVYTYSVASMDQADNSNAARMDNILINTRPTPVVLTLENAFFSPGTKSTKQTIGISLGVPVKEGISKWILHILNPANEVVRTFSGEAEIPSSISFDGKNQTGQILGEGKYSAKLTINYRKGNMPVAQSPDFTLDVTPPKASIDPVSDSFSPGGEGISIMEVKTSTTKEPEWVLSVFASNNPDQPLKSWTWPQNIPEKITWDGIGDNGKLLSDGTYILKASATDLAGNTTVVSSESFILDAKKRDAGIVADLQAFSPLGPSKKKKITLYPTLNDSNNLSEYQVRILKKDSGSTVKTFSGTNPLPESLSWDGLADSGAKAEDGSYYAQLTATFKTKVVVKAKTNDFQIDTVVPQVEFQSNYKVFSPNNDGKKDQISINVKTNKAIIWKGNLQNSKGIVVRSFTWKDLNTNLIWDGKDEAGNLLKDDSFILKVQGEDDAGNAATAEFGTIVLDNRQTQLFITNDKSAFAPLKADASSQVTFFITPKLNEGIEQWQINLTQKGKQISQLLSGKDTIPTKFIWDGKVNGKPLPDGEYQVKIQSVYLKGDEVQSLSSPVILDTSGPQVGISLEPEFFSPDNDGLNDELFISLKVFDLVGIERWKLSILSPQQKLFQEFQGTGQPAERLTWDGMSNKGEVVESASDYPYVFTVIDKLGNSTEVKGLISTDILVVRDGDRLKIKISSLKFAGGTADLQLGASTPEGISNTKTVNRLAEILRRFSSYKIRVEGHANRTIADPGQYESVDKPVLLRLSKERASSVLQALSKQGVDLGRMQAEGLGDQKMLAPWADINENWKNRRVEFYLVR